MLLRRDEADVLIHPGLQNIDIRNWRSYDQAVQEGYDTAKAVLSDLDGGPEALTVSQAPMSEISGL